MEAKNHFEGKNNAILLRAVWGRYPGIRACHTVSCAFVHIFIPALFFKYRGACGVGTVVYCFGLRDIPDTFPQLYSEAEGKRKVSYTVEAGKKVVEASV